MNYTQKFKIELDFIPKWNHNQAILLELDKRKLTWLGKGLSPNGDEVVELIGTKEMIKDYLKEVIDQPELFDEYAIALYGPYEEERDRLLDIINSNIIPSIEFCKEFRNRIPEEDPNMPEEYIGRDAEDYASWAYALFGDYHEDGENGVYDTRVLDFEQFYEFLEEMNSEEMDELQEAIDIIIKKRTM